MSTTTVTSDSAARELPAVLIGIAARDHRGAIPSITQAFVEGLSDRYRFIPFYAERRFGHTRQSTLHPLNLLYLFKHLLSWITLLIRYRPAIAHYPVTSYWNMEKSFTFLRVARLFGARPVGHLHGGGFVDFWRSLGLLRRRFGAASLRRLAALIVLSDGWKASIQEVTGDRTTRIFTVNNPLDLETQQRLLSLPAGRAGSTILFLGGLTTAKGVFDLIRASGQVLSGSSMKLALVGPEREPKVAAACAREIEALGLSDRAEVRLGAWGEEKLALFEDAAMLALPSYHENFPLVVFEAAAAALPAVVTRVGALPEFFVHEESVLFVEPGDVAGLAAALSRLRDDSALRKRLGENARQVFLQALSREAIMRSLDHVYQTVLQDRS